MRVQARHAVVGDIGGTHARFAIADIDELRIDDYVSFECSAFASLEDALAAYLRSVPDHPKTISLAVAGPIVGEAVAMTNLPWRTTKGAITAAAHAERVCLVNDFHATALCLPYLRPHDLMQIGGGAAEERATKVVLGAGTGLGVATLAWTGGRWTGLPGEGGHMTFAARTDEEFDLVKRLLCEIDHVCWETLVSGPGLARLYRLLQNGPDLPLTAPDIVLKASKDRDPTALRAIGLFVTWLGRLAGDVALLCGARGGVYIAGGIAPKISDFLAEGDFRAAFESKGVSSAYLGSIPIYLVKSPQAGLIGAALAAGAQLDTL